MEDLSRLAARLESLTALRDLFAAMQAMAASRVQAAQLTLSGARKFADEIEHAISDVVSLLPDQPPSPTPPDGAATSVLLVLCSEHGFTGAFNRLLLERTRAEARPREGIAIVGRRGAALAGEHGLSPAWAISMATSIDGVLPLARRAAAQLKDVDNLRMVFGKYCGGSRFEIEFRQILPPDPAIFAPRSGQARPLHQLEPRTLLQRLIGELLLAELALAMTESFASENSARLQIMQAADKNISEKLEGLTHTMRQLRQEAITSELFEVVAGGEAVARSRIA